MSKDKPKKDDPRKEAVGGKAGRSPGKTTKTEKSSGGIGRDRPAKGYALGNWRRKPPPEDKPPTKGGDKK